MLSNGHAHVFLLDLHVSIEYMAAVCNDLSVGLIV